MAARKKQEAVEEAEVKTPVDKLPAAKKPATKKPAAKKPEVVPVAQPESVAVPAEMLSQLMAQIQTLTQEVGELRTKALEPVVGAGSSGESGALSAVDDSQEESVKKESVSDLGEVSEIEVKELEASHAGFSVDIEAFNGDGESDEGSAITAEESGALLAGFDAAMSEDEVEVEAAIDEEIATFAPVSEVVEEASVSAEAISAMFASLDQGSESASTDLSDDEIAQAIEIGANQVEKVAEVEEEFEDDLEDLTEEDLVAMIQQNIAAQAQSLDEKEAEEAAQALEIAAAAEALEAEGSGVMSAAEIAALLATPDEDGDVVPQQSSAMSDADLMALLSESGSGGESAPIPTADDIGEVSFVQEQKIAATPVARPISTPKPPTGEAELGAIKAVPAQLAVRAMALPVRFEEGKILCKVAEPIDRPALDQLSKAIGFGIIIEPTPIDQVVAGLRVAYAEFQDFNARIAVMSGAQNHSGLVEKISNLWKKSA